MTGQFIESLFNWFVLLHEQLLWEYIPTSSLQVGENVFLKNKTKVTFVVWNGKHACIKKIEIEFLFQTSTFKLE